MPSGPAGHRMMARNIAEASKHCSLLKRLLRHYPSVQMKPPLFTFTKPPKNNEGVSKSSCGKSDRANHRATVNNVVDLDSLFFGPHKKWGIEGRWCRGRIKGENTEQSWRNKNSMTSASFQQDLSSSCWLSIQISKIDSIPRSLWLMFDSVKDFTDQYYFHTEDILRRSNATNSRSFLLYWCISKNMNIDIKNSTQISNMNHVCLIEPTTRWLSNHKVGCVNKVAKTHYGSWHSHSNDCLKMFQFTAVFEFL